MCSRCTSLCIRLFTFYKRSRVVALMSHVIALFPSRFGNLKYPLPLFAKTLVSSHRGLGGHGSKGADSVCATLHELKAALVFLLSGLLGPLQVSWGPKVLQTFLDSKGSPWKSMFSLSVKMAVQRGRWQLKQPDELKTTLILNLLSLPTACKVK